MLIPEDIHFIPVKHELQYNAQKGSAGQTQISQLAEVIENVRKPIIGLDEWPANLDVENIRMVDGILQEYSKHVCIVEVRNDAE